MAHTAETQKSNVVRRKTFDDMGSAFTNTEHSALDPKALPDLLLTCFSVY